MQTEDVDDWRWWRQIVVRGSGFPANGVLCLANEELAGKADALVVNADRGSEAWQAFREEFREAAVDLATELQSIASRDDFLRAVTWQNHRLMDQSIRPFLRWDPAKDTRRREAPAAGRIDRQVLAAVLRQERHDRLLRAVWVGQAG